MEPRGFGNRSARRWRDALATGIAACWGVLTVSGCWRGDSLPAEDPGRMTIALHSPTFRDGELIPKTYTCDGADRSPPLEWSGVPGVSRSLALICDDPDAPMGTFSHWVLFNLPPQVQALAEGVSTVETITVPGNKGSGSSGAADALQAQPGRNDFGKIGYGGPCPPSGTHHYVFRLYALDQLLETAAGATKAQVVTAMKGHVLAEGQLMGRYGR